MSTDLHWFKSSYSGGQGGECVEVALTPTTIHIRDSKSTDHGMGATVRITPTTWSDFINSLP